MKGHEDLVVWQKAMDLVVSVYGVTRDFPKSEWLGLASQMQRAAVSVPSSIAEGHALKQAQAYARHLAIASGLLAKLQTPPRLPARLGYAGDWEKLIEAAREVGRMLAGLRRSLRECA